MREKLRKRLLTALKIIVSAALIYFIFTKININDVLLTLKKSNPFYLIAALMLYAISKVLSAFRLNLYFHQIGAHLTQKSNLALHLLGMFYNLFLPGGIGGDAYKGYVIQKEYKPGTKKVVAVLLLDRLSGLLLIFIYACLLAFLSAQSIFQGFDWLFVIAIPVSVFVFWLFIKRLFAYTLTVFWKSLSYSALVQLAQLLSAWCILQSLSLFTDILEYLLVFLVSSIVSVIPLTIGGIGSREVTFLYGAKMAWVECKHFGGYKLYVFFLLPYWSHSSVLCTISKNQNWKPVV